MRLLGGSLSAATLAAIVLLCFSSLSYSADANDQGDSTAAVDRQVESPQRYEESPQRDGESPQRDGESPQLEDNPQPEEESLRFWEEWNAVIAELIRRELEAPDPWESWNRKVYAFNDFADRIALRPVAKAYQWVTPAPVEQGIGNMFANLRDINTIINGLLQFKLAQAASDTGRVLLNSTVGLAGLFDVATPIGLKKHNEDFGQTLGYWGVGSGPYLVVPFLGSYTLRDGLGAFVDTYADYIRHVDHVPTRNQLYATRYVHNRAALFSAEELITGDRYTFVRDAYLQRREYLVNDGIVEDSFGEEDEWDDEDWDDEDWQEE